MNFSIKLIISLWLVPNLNAQQIRNKTKRTLSNDEVNYGDPSTVWLYTDNLKPQVTPRNIDTVYANSKPLALIELQPVKIVDQPKEITQPAFYEIDQTATNIAPNVKQLIGQQTEFSHEIHRYRPPLLPHPSVYQSPNILTSETVVTPVQHSHVIRNHNQHFGAPRIHPLYNVQPNYQLPKKYAYVNGKIIYDPNSLKIQQVPPTTTPHFYHSAQVFQPQPQLQKQPLINYQNRYVTRPVLQPPAIQQPPLNLPAITKLEHPKMQVIDTPSNPPPQQQQSLKKVNHEDEKPVREEDEEEENDERSSYNDDEYDPYEDDRPFNEKYSLEDEDGDHLDELDGRDESEESDSNRGSSRNRYVTAKFKKYPKKKYKSVPKSGLYYGDHFRYPKKYHKKNNVKHNRYKYPKNWDDPEAGFSENVPLIHKQKLFKEKWFVSKSLSDKEKFEDKL